MLTFFFVCFVEREKKKLLLGLSLGFEITITLFLEQSWNFDVFGFVLEVFVCVVGTREFSVFGTLFTQFVSCFLSLSLHLCLCTLLVLLIFFFCLVWVCVDLIFDFHVACCLVNWLLFVRSVFFWGLRSVLWPLSCLVLFLVNVSGFWNLVLFWNPFLVFFFNFYAS